MVSSIHAHFPQPQSAPAQIPALTARSFSSALLVASLMTEPPTLWTSLPTGGAGDDLRGEGVGWLPSLGIHVLWFSNCKLQPTHLIYVGADGNICFGVIGTKHFCRIKGCSTKAHKSKANKFGMGGSKDCWFILGKSNLTGQPNCFIYPFLDTAKITENTTLSLKSYSEWWMAAEWEEFIFEVQEEWEELQAHAMLENIQEGHGDGDQDNDNKDLFMCEGNLIVSKPPDVFVLLNKINKAVIKEKLDEGDPKNTQGVVEELQVAIEDLEGMVVEARWDSRHNAKQILTHVGYSVSEIVAAIDRINWRG